MNKKQLKCITCVCVMIIINLVHMLSDFWLQIMMQKSPLAQMFLGSMEKKLSKDSRSISKSKMAAGGHLGLRGWLMAADSLVTLCHTKLCNTCFPTNMRSLNTFLASISPLLNGPVINSPVVVF